MLQLVYISTGREIPTEEMLDSILAASRRNNRAIGVTGLLVVGGRRFLQALEGPEQAVLDTYGRIKLDERHRALVLLSCRTVGARAFGDWAMGFERGADAPDGDLRQLIEGLTDRLADRNLRAQFRGFAELHARAA